MDFKTLADIKVLHEKALAAAKAEKAATYYLLECLHQIDRTRDYLELGYSTLFEYVHRALGYSESQAYERIAAMRLAFKVPEVGTALKTGELTLTSVARIAQHSKRESLAPQTVAELATRLAHRSVREVERVLASEVKCPVPQREVLRPSSAATSTLTITIDSEFESLLKEARELENDPTLSMAEVLKRALKMRVEAKKIRKGWRTGAGNDRQLGQQTIGRTAIEKLGQDQDNKTLPLRTSGVDSVETAAIVNGVRSQRSRYIPAKIRQAIWTKSSGRCSFKSPVTGVRCSSRQSLQIDHKLAFSLAGSNELGNLELLCATHNRGKGMG